MVARIINAVAAALVGVTGAFVYAQLRAPTIAPEAPQAAQPAQVVYAPANEREQWAYDMATMLGNAQPTPETIAFVVEWTLAEDSSMGAFGRNNPLNTTMCGYNQVGAINGDGACGVGHYATYQDGLDATIATLAQSNFAAIAAALQANDPESARLALWASPWASSHYNGGVGWPNYPIAPQKPAQQAKCPVTDTMQVSARFTDTSSGYWAGQAGGMHNGTDYAGNPGDSVYAPFAFVVEDVGYYGDPGRVGYYIQGRFADGVLFYAGHLGTVGVTVGQQVAACDAIGTIGGVYHTHIKIATADKPIPCESMGCDDFETYWSER